MRKKVSKKAALSFGWKTYRKNALYLSGILILIYIVQIISNNLIKFHYLGGSQVDMSAVPIGRQYMYLLWIIVIGSVISTVAKVGMVKVSLKIYRGEKIKLKDFFTDMKSYIRFMLASVLYMLIFILLVLLYLFFIFVLEYFIDISFLLVVLPLILMVYIIEVSFIFYGYLIVDKKSSVIKSFEESEKLINGYRIDFSFFLVMILALNLLGAVTVIGNLITIPVTVMSTTYIYTSLSEKKMDESKIE